MADPAGENILKVLSGNQFGAEVTLTDGTYTFGSGPEADIHLLDVALQPRHGQIRLRDGKIELRALEGDLATASGLSVAKDDDSWHEIAQMDAITAGLSKFVIAGAGANWTSLAAPAPPPPPRKFDTAPLDRLFSAVPRRALFGAGAVGAFVILMALFSGGGGDAAPRSGAEVEAAAIAALRQSVEAMPFARQIRVTERADGSLAIEGYVEDQVERRALQNSLDESGLGGTLRVYVRENLRADIAGTIDSMKVPADFTLDDAGNLTLSGTVLDPAAAEKLVETIQTGVFGLASVKSEIRTADQILSDLRGISRDAGLGDLVIFRLDGLVVEATGIVPRDKMDNWVGLIGVYSRRFAKEIPLRSFVTLDQPAQTGTAPVIIGSGPVAEAESGRVVAPETLAEPNEVDARSLFAGPPGATPTETPAPQPAQTAAAAAGLPPALASALAALRENQPDLYAALQRDIDAGATPDPDLLQQIMTALDGRMQTTTAEDGKTTVEVVIPGIGSLGTLDSLSAQLRAGLGTAPAPVAQEPVASAPVAAAPLAQAASLPQPAAAPPEAEAPAPTAAAEAPAPAAPAVPDATAPAVASTAPEAVAPLAAPSGITVLAAPEQALEPALQPLGQTAAGMPFFALPGAEAQKLDRLMAEAQSALSVGTGATGGAGISPNLQALVAMQHEQLSLGRTFMRLPRPLSALPYPVDEAVACWKGGKLTPEALPTTLLLLDALSVSADSDITRIAPDLRDTIMEAALSPARLRACLAKTRTDYGRMVGESSAFLAEAARNPDFVQFVFRNVPRAELPIVGANLQDDRYIELADGRKLGEGAAPDITSRILAIGDSGVLVRTADGTILQLFGNSLGWRVVDACASPECGVN